MFVDLLLKRLKAYGFWDKSLTLMCSYLENRKKEIQINNYFSSEKKVIAGVAQGSINGLLLFDLFINDHALFLRQCFLSNYADNNNLYSTGNNTELAKMDLQTDFRAITNCFLKMIWYWTLRSAIICASEETVQMIHLYTMARKQEETARKKQF